MSAPRMRRTSAGDEPGRGGRTQVSARARALEHVFRATWQGCGDRDDAETASRDISVVNCARRYANVCTRAICIFSPCGSHFRSVSRFAVRRERGRSVRDCNINRDYNLVPLSSRCLFSGVLPLARGGRAVVYPELGDYTRTEDPPFLRESRRSSRKDPKSWWGEPVVRTWRGKCVVGEIMKARVSGAQERRRFLTEFLLNAFNFATRRACHLVCLFFFVDHDENERDQLSDHGHFPSSRVVRF